MNLGICYYPEHWDETRWALDAQSMREVGLTIVRFAEFAWSRLEPRPNEFDFAWLDRAIDVFAASGFSIVLGTPTAAPPAWLARAHPDILPVDDQRRKRDFGGRRHYCPNSPVYREYSTQIVQAMAAHYLNDPRVIGWQIDNEFGGGNTARCYCENCASAFRVWLAQKYRTVDTLNDAWGNVFWSQEYDDWQQINAPILVAGNKPNPSHVLDYYRFASDSFVTYQALQISILREAQQQIVAAEPNAASLTSSSQFITHNFMGLYSDLDQYALAEPLTFVAWDSYPTGNLGRWKYLLADADNGVYAHDAGNPYVTGMAHDFTRGLKEGAPFWIMEQQAGQVNWGEYNPAPRPDVLQLWLWHNFASGVETTIFFRERATLFAQEQYHSGLLNHDGSPGQPYQDLLAFRPQHALMKSLEASRVENEVALLVSFEDLWALQTQPHRKDFSYWNVVFTWYAALLRAGVPCDIVSKKADISKYKLVIAASLHLADGTLADRLKRYVSAGGLLVVGIRSGFKALSNKVTSEPLPGALRELVGAKVTGWQSLAPNVSQPVALTWREGYPVNATRWIETLEPDRARTTATYVNSHLHGHAAMTVNQIGEGRVTYVGWWPDQSQADALVGMLLPEAQIESPGNLPHGIIVGRRVSEGETYFILMNFADEEKTVLLNGTGWRKTSGDEDVNGQVTLAARGVRVLIKLKPVSTE